MSSTAPTPRSGNTGGNTGGTAAGRTRPSGGTPAVARIAGILAAVAVVSLAIILVGELFGAQLWPGFVWIVLLAFPLAFILLGGLVIASIRHRRSV
jgi:fatty acid desaturase